MARAPDGGGGDISGGGSVGSGGDDDESGGSNGGDASKVTAASLSGSGEVSEPRPPIAKLAVGSGAKAAVSL